MPMFLYDWPERASLLIDDVSEPKAREVALDIAEQEAPSRVRQLPPRVVVCELLAVDGLDGDVIVLRAFPHVLDALGELLEDDEPSPPPPLRLVDKKDSRCIKEATAPDGSVVRCELPSGHGPHHVSGSLAWVKA